MEDKRTKQQNKALYLYFTQLAEALNDAGYDMKAILKPEIDIPWNKDTVHDFLWIPIQRLQIKKDSTTLLEKKEIDLIYETLNRFVAKKGIHVPFPNEADRYLNNY